MKYVRICLNRVNNLIVWIERNPGESLRILSVTLGVILALVILFSIVELLNELMRNKSIEKNSVLMEILPKETTKIKETENLIKNIHSTLVNTKWRKVAYGRPYMSFEITAVQGKIKFYIKVPKDYVEFIRERMYSTYPEIAIREAEEDPIPERVWVTPLEIVKYIYGVIYNKVNKIDLELKRPQNHLIIKGTEMELGSHHILSIKNNNEKDILGSILSGMKDLEWHEKVFVQILARPLDGKWQDRGWSELRQYERKGKSLVRGSDTTNFLSSLGETISEELGEELDRQGLGGFKRKAEKKTRRERKEISVATDKLLEPGFETVIRVMTVGHYGKSCTSKVKGITAAFSELDKQNRFKRDVIFNHKLFYRRFKNRRMYLIDRKNILTPSELSSFFLRLPGEQLLNDFPDIEALTVKEFAPPKNVETKTNIFAKNLYRGKETYIGIKDEDMVRHIIVQGMTGSGKSEWLKTLLKEHVEKGRGLLLLEPHGKLADEFLEIIPENRRNDVIYFDLFDDYPPPFNFCKVKKRKGVSVEDAVEKTATEVIEIFKKAFSDAWSGKNEHYFENGIKTIIELQNGNILDIQRLFTDKEFRQYAIENIKDPQLKQFWLTEFKEDARGKLSQGTEGTVSSVLYKLGKFLNSKKFLRAVAQDDCIDFKDILDNNKIIIFRLSKDKMSKDRIEFIGGVAIKLAIVAAFQRDPKVWNVPFIWAIDEAQNFINESIETVLDELRKYGICLLPMHQRLAQLDKVEGLKDAIYGNVGTMITFTVGEPDGPYFEKLYGPRVDKNDLTRLPSRYGYCRLKVDGQTSETFNIYSLDRPQVEKAIGKQSIYEIKTNNRKQRLHFKEIDRLLDERISDYRKVDELGKEIKEESFVEDISEEYEKIETTKRLQKSQEVEFITGDELPFGSKDDFTGEVESNYSFGDEDYNEESEIEFDEEMNFNFEIRDIDESLFEKSDDKLSSIPENEVTDAKEEIKELKRKIKIADFIEDRTEIIDEDKTNSKISIGDFSEKQDDKNEYKEKDSVANLWQNAKEKEKIALEEKTEKPAKQIEGQNLWQSARAKEKGKK